eukprot:gene33272-40254_t
MSTRTNVQKACLELLELAEKSQVAFPKQFEASDRVKACKEALLHHVYGGDNSFDQDAALYELKHKYGHKAKGTKRSAPTHKDQGYNQQKTNATSEGSQDQDTDLPHTEDGHVAKIATVDVEANRPIAALLLEMSGLYFEHHVVGKGMAYSKAAKSVRECDHVIHNAHEADALKGIGKHIADHIQEYLDTGRIRQLEDMRRGKIKRR